MTMFPDVLAALTAAEDAVDHSPNLTRRSAKVPGYLHTAQMRMDRDEFTLIVPCRGERARGRGAKGMTDIHGSGATLAEALADFISNLPHWERSLNE